MNMVKKLMVPVFSIIIFLTAIRSAEAEWSAWNKLPISTLGFGSLFFDSSSKTLFATTDSRGFIVSSMDGINWKPVANNLGLSYSSLVYDPGSKTTFIGTINSYAYVNGIAYGVMKSTNGDNWTTVGNAASLIDTWGGYLVFDSASGTLFVGNSAGVFSSTNGGDWVPVAGNAGLANKRVYSLVYDPNFKTLYAGTSGGVFSSANGGNWVPVANNRGLTDQWGQQGLSVGGLAYDFVSKTLFASSQDYRKMGVFSSTNGGDWIPVANNAGLPLYMGALIYDSPSRTIFVGSKGGVFSSVNGGAWTLVSNNAGLTASTTVYDLAYDSDSATIFIKTYDGVYSSAPRVQKLSLKIVGPSEIGAGACTKFTIETEKGLWGSPAPKMTQTSSVDVSVRPGEDLWGVYIPKISTAGRVKIISEAGVSSGSTLRARISSVGSVAQGSAAAGAAAAKGSNAAAVPSSSARNSFSNSMLVKNSDGQYRHVGLDKSCPSITEAASKIVIPQGGSQGNFYLQGDGKIGATKIITVADGTGSLSGIPVMTKTVSIRAAQKHAILISDLSAFPGEELAAAARLEKRGWVVRKIDLDSGDELKMGAQLIKDHISTNIFGGDQVFIYSYAHGGAPGKNYVLKDGSIVDGNAQWMLAFPEFADTLKFPYEDVEEWRAHFTSAGGRFTMADWEDIVSTLEKRGASTAVYDLSCYSGSTTKLLEIEYPDVCAMSHAATMETVAMAFPLSESLDRFAPAGTMDDLAHSVSQRYYQQFHVNGNQLNAIGYETGCTGTMPMRETLNLLDNDIKDGLDPTNDPHRRGITRWFLETLNDFYSKYGMTEAFWNMMKPSALRRWPVRTAYTTGLMHYQSVATTVAPQVPNSNITFSKSLEPIESACVSGPCSKQRL